jgi:histidinol-phosphate phosphatase family protein
MSGSETARAPRSAVFIDKDGTLVENVPYNVDPARIVLVPGAATALCRLARLGYRLFVVSNQAGLALGRFDEAALGRAWRHLAAMLSRQGVALDGFYYCPHHPQGSVAAWASACTCRKPAPGMLLRAAAENGIDLATSWMMGDILDDVEAGRRAGCRTVLVEVGNETEGVRSPWRTPDLVASGLAQAAALIPPPGPGVADSVFGAAQ